MLPIDHYDQHQARCRDCGECRGRGDHEHDDHLEARGLLDGGAAEDGAGHHAWDGDDAEDARGEEEELERVQVGGIGLGEKAMKGKENKGGQK